MSLHTTFRIGGPADYYAEPESSEEVKQLIEEANQRGIPYFLLGRGSNLLVGDAGYRGMMICLGKAFSKISLCGKEVEAQAGASLFATANYAAAHALSGLEFASGIPGTVGGGLVMNAGAYGGEMKDVLSEAEVLFPDGKIAWLPVSALEYSYRHSNIEALCCVILRAHFSLKEGKREEIEALMKDYNQRRKEKQPLEFPSAGSAFKRPPGQFAGELIERAGCKGLKIGGAQISEKHAGFLINADCATAGDVRKLIEEVKRRVFACEGVTLEPEIKYIGEFL